MHFYSAINVIASWKRVGHQRTLSRLQGCRGDERRGGSWGHLRFTTSPKQSTKGRGRLPGNTIPIAAGSRVAQKNKTKKTLITLSSAVSRKKVPVLHQLRLGSSTHACFQSYQLVPAIYQQSRSQQRETAAVGLQPAGVFAQLMKTIACVVLFLGCSLRPAYLNGLSNIFFIYYFHAGKDVCWLWTWRIYLAANFLKNKS